MVVGVDLAAGRGDTAVAALRLRDGAQPELVAPVYGALAADAEIVAAVASFRPAFVALDAPLTLPRAVTAALLEVSVGTHNQTTPLSGECDGSCAEGSSSSTGRAGRGIASDHKGAERPASEAMARGARSASNASSPYTRAAERDSIWSRLGVRPLPVSFLGGLTFRAIALLPRLRATLPDATIVEVFPSATLAALGIARSQPAGPRQRKSTPTSRLVVQLALARFVAGMPDPEPQPLSADALDAITAALTAAASASGDYILAGDPDEGQIVLPTPR